MSDNNDEGVYAEVIPLRPQYDSHDSHDGQRPLATGPRPKEWCQHRQTILTAESRRVHCADCKREVPAFDALMDLAQDWERLIEWRKVAAKRRKQAEAELAEITRELRNAKNRRRNARKREPEAIQMLRKVADLTRARPAHGVIAEVHAYLKALDEAADS